MEFLILGVLLWSGAHLFKRLAPTARAKLGERGKSPIAIVIVASVLMMVIGYRGNESDVLYVLPEFTRHINNLLMLIAVALLGLGNSKSRLRAKMRHPMLAGVVVWSVAHLLVNGDVASIVLFGGLLIWALVEMVVINAKVSDYVPYTGGSVAGDVRLALITLVVFAVIGVLHMYIGPSPFPM
ncbi:NnrU family protein [Celeribacter sp.]|uniref:NnrU family protein n=1 Tax=Celeribacter sp. TaxID=1890673 RepID=UPI003A916E6C